MKQRTYTIEKAAAFILVVAFPTLFLAKLGWLLVRLIFAYFGVYVIYRAFGFLRFGVTRWIGRHVADSLDLQMSTEQVPYSPPADAGPLVQFFEVVVVLMANNRMSARLWGTVAGQSVALTAEPTAVGRVIDLEVDCSEVFPDWLELRTGRGPATTRRWFDVEDVLVGDREFDDRFLVRGTSKDDVRQFFLEHNVTEELVELGRTLPNMRLEEGRLRVTHGGVFQRPGKLVEQLRALAVGARTLREAAESEVVADFDEQQEEVEESVHVYD